MKRAVLMSRVSSDEQAKGYSLDVQSEQLIRYCQGNDIAIIRQYREDHSAKDFNRPEFKAFMAFARQNKGKVDSLLFTTWDRFSRNIRDALNVIEELKKLGITPHAIHQPLDMSIPENLAMLAIYLSMPEIDNKRRSIKIKEGMDKALEQGRWCRMAPRGYRNARDEDNKPVILPGKHAENIRMAFEKIAEGYSQAQVRELLKAMGCNVSRSALSLMLRNPVYIGRIAIGNSENGNTSSASRWVEGKHEGIITEQLFATVQDCLHSKRRRKLQSGNSRHREELPLRGNLICKDCSHKLTGSASRSRTGKRHFYYHCNHCRKQRIPARIADQLLRNALSEFKFKGEVQALYQKMLASLRQSGEARSRQSAGLLKEKRSVLTSRIENLQDHFADGKLQFTDYAAMKARYESQLYEIDEKLRVLSTEKQETVNHLKGAVNLLSNLGEFYKKADSKAKQQLIGSIFPENLKIAGDKCRTTRINEVLGRLLVIDKGLPEKKTGYSTENLEISRLVDLKGVEPLIS